MAKEKKDEFNSADMKLRRPDIQKIQCKDCIFREKDRFNGAVKGATLSLCECFDGKPYDILWENAECIYYESEDDE